MLVAIRIAKMNIKFRLATFPIAFRVKFKYVLGDNKFFSTKVLKYFGVKYGNYQS